VDDGAAINVWDGFAQNLVGERCDVAFAKEEEAEDVGDGIALSPFEVDVRDSAGDLLDVNEQGGNGVGNHGAADMQDAVSAQRGSVDLQLLSEL
jgi:hypothetical protein